MDSTDDTAQSAFAKKLASIQANPGQHRHDDLNALQRCCFVDGAIDLGLIDAHAQYAPLGRNGDILIVGIDSDELTRIRKGKNRPIVPQRERIEMLVHLRHVDVVVLRDVEQDIGDLIRLVKPDVLITSTSTKDFTAEQVRDYNKWCKEIVTLNPQSTTSTTARIRDLTIEGAEKLSAEINQLTKEFIDKIRKA